MNASYSYNSSIEDYDSPASYEDPTDIVRRNGYQYAPSAGIGAGGGSKLGGIPINAKWIARINGSYRLPREVNIAATRTCVRVTRFSVPPTLPIARTGHRPSVAAERFPSFAMMDLRIDRLFRIGQLSVLPSLDVFNIFNANTVMGRRTNQNAANANLVFGILAPRIARVGVMVTF